MFGKYSLVALALSIGQMLFSQNVSLHLEFISDSSSTKNKFKTQSFDDAERLMNSKVDSLKKTSYPFLNLETTYKENALIATLRLHQNIETVQISIAEEHASYLPKSIQVSDNKFIIDYKDVERFLTSVIENLRRQGSSFGKAYLSDISTTDEHQIKATLNLETGLKRTIDKLHTRGYTELSPTFIRRFSNLKLGDMFVEEQVQQKTEQLGNIPFISITKPTEVLFKKDSTELFLYLEKINANSFDGFLGFGNSEESGFQLNGYFNMVLLNNLNFGERLSVIYKNDGIGQQTFEGKARLPFLFKSPISLEAGLRIFRRDSLFSNSSQLLDINYQLNEKINFSGGVEFTNSTNLENENNSLSNEVVDFNSTFYSLGFNYLKLNSRQGFNEDSFLNLKVSLGKRDALIASEQYKLDLNGQHQLVLNARNKIFLNLKSQILISDSYVNNELFRFGGVNSIRGFAENVLIANRFAVLQTEYRYILDANLFANSVLDIGNYQNKLDGINENILGYGVGLGLQSKAGIFKLILANSISETEETRLGNSKIHISFTSFF